MEDYPLLLGGLLTGVGCWAWRWRLAWSAECAGLLGFLTLLRWSLGDGFVSDTVFSVGRC